MKYPEIAIVNEHEYKINTDFRIALECDRIARDDNVSDIERSLAIICLLFGEEALDNPEDYEKLKDMAIKYLTCGKGISKNKDKVDMDYQQDMDYIEASFMSDYKIDLENTDMHWYKFNNLMEGLSNSEDGNCCILNRIRNYRNIDPSKIKDSKIRQEVIDTQKRIALKEDKVELTEEQERSMKELDDLLGL